MFLAKTIYYKFVDCVSCSVDVSVKRVGGAYGAKITRAHWIAAGCALAANATRRSHQPQQLEHLPSMYAVHL